jgi:hypothetical protein
MKNTRLVRSYVFAGVGIGTLVWFTLKTDNSKIQNFYSSIKNRFIQPSDMRVINKAGNPDPHDIDDNKMVSEGAMYAVNYYNEKQQ